MKDYIVTLLLFVSVWLGGFLVSSFVFNPPTCVSIDICDLRMILGMLLSLLPIVYLYMIEEGEVNGV